MQIRNIDIIKELEIKESTFYEWKKRSPRQVELIRKGIEYEKLISESIKRRENEK